MVLAIVKAGRGCVIFIVVAVDFLERRPVGAPHAFAERRCIFLMLMMYNLFLGHFGIGRGFALFHNFPQGLIFVPELVDFADDFVPERFEVGLGVRCEAVHFPFDGFVLLLDLSEAPEGAVDVVLVKVAFGDEGDIGVLIILEIHNDSLNDND